MYQSALITRLPGSEGKKKTMDAPTQEVGTKVGTDQLGSLI